MYREGCLRFNPTSSLVLQSTFIGDVALSDRYSLQKKNNNKNRKTLIGGDHVVNHVAPRTLGVSTNLTYLKISLALIGTLRIGVDFSCSQANQNLK